MAQTTWSTTDKSAVTLSGSNLIGTATGVGWVRAADKQSTGKFYWEVKPTVWANANTGFGLCPGTVTPAGNTAIGITEVFKSGNIWVDGANTGSTLAARAANDVIGIAADFDAKLVWYRVAPSGNWNGSATANPATGIGGIATGAVGGGAFAAYPVATLGATSEAVTANFGGSAFTGTVPSGFTSGFTSGATPGNNQIVTQAAIEEWGSGTPAMQVTQVAIEEWGPGVPQAWVTQAGGSVWVTQANPPVYVTQAGGIVWVDANIVVLYPTGISSGEAVGTPTLIVPLTLSPSGIASTAALGTPTIVVSVVLSPTGIPSGEAVGTPTLSVTIVLSPTGIPSGEAVGTPTLNVQIILSPSGIPSGEAVGSPRLVFPTVNLSATGIASTEAVGSPILHLAVASLVYKWYWNFTEDAAKWTVLPEERGAGFGLSPNGGVLRISDGQFPNNGNVITIPGNTLNSGSDLLPSIGVGHWRHFYLEFCAEFRTMDNQSVDISNGWPALWVWSAQNLTDYGFGGSSLNAPNATEIDVMECFGTIFDHTTPGMEATSFNHGPPDLSYPLGSVALPNGSSGWHRYGLLWTPTVIETYFDDIRMGTQPTSLFNLETDNQSLFIIMGTGNAWTLNVDWVRVWQ